MNPLTVSLHPYAAAAVAIVLILIVGTIFVLDERLKVVTAQKLELAAGLTQVTDANATDMTTIASLKRSLDVWQKTATDARAAAQQAALDVASAQQARAQVEVSLKVREHADVALPDCTRLLSTDLANVCPAHATTVKARAR
jgi:hypothetical protein